ncbi:MAG: hypothetical protein Q9165_001913 [Trypethelium subeluteriae]
MDDASTFLDSIRRVLQAYQISIRDSPTPLAEHRDTMSSVVQKLEQVAVTKPFQGRRSDSLSTNQSSSAPSMTRGTTASSPPAESRSVFVPMAYNPAAPAAPEPIKHREKTPPPIDAEDGTGLAAAAMHDQAPMHATHQWANPYAQAHPQLQQPGYFSGQPQRQTSASSMPPPPPPTLNGSVSPGNLQRSGTFPPPPSQASSTSQLPTPQGYPYAPSSIGSPPLSSDPNSQYTNHYSPARHPSQTSQTSYTSTSYNPSQPYSPAPNYTPGAPSTSSPPQPSPAPNTPGLGIPAYSPVPSQGQSPHPQQQEQPPPGGYSQYSYAQSQPDGFGGGGGSGASTGPPHIQPDHAYLVHQQAYRPTEAEAGAHAQARLQQPGPPPPLPMGAAGAGGAAGNGKFEARVDRVEKGVGRFLKKLDKKL